MKTKLHCSPSIYIGIKICSAIFGIFGTQNRKVSIVFLVHDGQQNPKSYANVPICGLKYANKWLNNIDTEQNRTEQNRTEQNSVDKEQNRTKQNISMKIQNSTVKCDCNHHTGMWPLSYRDIIALYCTILHYTRLTFTKLHCNTLICDTLH